MLSVFADAGGAEGVRHGPRAGEITLRQKLDVLVASVRRDGPRERRRALRDRLDGLAGELERPSTRDTPAGPLACLPERGRARVGAYLRPLLAPLDAGRPLGIAARLGATRAPDRLALRTDIAGAAGAHPG